MQTKDIANFIQRYRLFYESHKKERISYDKDRFTRIFNEVAIIKKVYEKTAGIYAHNFNIFNILLVSNKEVTTHSPILGNLLDINGSHGQGSLFYDNFINYILKKPEEKENFRVKNAQYFNLKLEHNTGSGRIDLLITYNDNVKKFAICIENKVYASDQENQLKRYYDYLITNRYKKSEILIIYITPNKSEPTEHSISTELFKELYNEVIFLIGYNKDLSIILENTIQSIRSEKVKQTLSQYISIIKSI